MYVCRLAFRNIKTVARRTWGGLNKFAYSREQIRHLHPSSSQCSSEVVLREVPLRCISEEIDDSEEVALEQEYSEIKRSLGMQITRAENLLLIHPKVNSRRPSSRNSHHKNKSTLELQVEEAQALCQTIPQFQVLSSVIVNTDDSVRKKLIWKSGRLEALNQYRQQLNASALMINVDMLSPLQQRELTHYFGVPIYDRYNIVLSIFKIYARTKEAKLQIALAEIPYIRERLELLNVLPAASANDIAALSNTSCSKRLEILKMREHKIQKQIRITIESAKQQLIGRKLEGGPTKTPIVGVVGYTNAGKTTLIKRLTNSQHLMGEDRLFATLDTTTHNATLPSSSQMLLADTIGFISNLPVKLFASFTATLQHIEKADLLLHVMDLSHPDLLAQRDIVLETLERLKIRTDNILNVGNKLDKCDQERRDRLIQWGILTQHGGEDDNNNSNNLFPLSCRTAEGMPKLVAQLDKCVQVLNGSRIRRLRLSPTSKLIAQLYEEKLVINQPVPSECGNFLIFDVLMNDQRFAKFQAAIGQRLKRSGE